MVVTYFTYSMVAHAQPGVQSVRSALLVTPHRWPATPLTSGTYRTPMSEARQEHDEELDVSARYPPRRAAESATPARRGCIVRMRLVSLVVLLACLLGSASSQATSKSAKPRGKLVGKSPSSSIVGKVSLRPAFLTAAKRSAAQSVAQPCSCGWRC